MVKKCTKKCDSRAKLLFCFFNLLMVLFDVLVEVLSLDLKVPVMYVYMVVSLVRTKSKVDVNLFFRPEY